MTLLPDDIGDALRAQAHRLAASLEGVDLHAPTVVAGWTTGMLIAHLRGGLDAVAASAEAQQAGTPGMDLAAWAQVTQHSSSYLAESVTKDSAAAASLAEAGDRIASAAHEADGSLPVFLGGRPTLSLTDGLRARAVELVVHGLDFLPPVQPDDRCAAVAAAALLEVLAARVDGDAIAVDVSEAGAVSAGTGAPGSVSVDSVTWLRLATGRLSFADAVDSGAAVVAGGGDALAELLPVLT